MHYNDIKEAMHSLALTSYQLEEIYNDNGGEVTEETELMEQQREALAYVLANDGADTLGRWLKSLEDKKATIKDEKNAIAAQEKSVDRSIDFVKAQISEIMRLTGTDKVKGQLYSFSAYKSVKTAANAELIEAMYMETAKRVLREAGIPEYITLKLSASVKAVPEGVELPEVFTRTEEDTVKFSKPRKAKEE